MRSSRELKRRPRAQKAWRPLAVRILAQVDAAFAGLELGPRHAAGPL
jgi:hypothetical protein